MAPLCWVRSVCNKPLVLESRFIELVERNIERTLHASVFYRCVKLRRHPLATRDQFPLLVAHHREASLLPADAPHLAELEAAAGAEGRRDQLAALQERRPHDDAPRGEELRQRLARVGGRVRLGTSIRLSPGLISSMCIVHPNTLFNMNQSSRHPLIVIKI